jgi:hypothetical protein
MPEEERKVDMNWCYKLCRKYEPIKTREDKHGNCMFLESESGDYRSVDLIGFNECPFQIVAGNFLKSDI